MKIEFRLAERRKKLNEKVKELEKVNMKRLKNNCLFDRAYLI